MLAALPYQAMAQQGKPVASASYTEEEILLDGFADESAWASAEILSDFVSIIPEAGEQPRAATSVRIVRDKFYIYVLVECSADPSQSEYVVQTLQRDFDIYENDAFTIVIDAFNDKNNGRYFTISPFNVQAEGTIVNPRGKLDNTWDAVWFGISRQHSAGWVAELAIPLNIIGYDPEIQTWNVNFVRSHARYSAVSVWDPVEQNLEPTNLEQAGAIRWTEPVKRVGGGNVAAIPYATMLWSRDLSAGQRLFDPSYKAGLDLKWGITTSLNLDVTINPDFSQVDLDQEIINLSRFEVSFPERRQFFTENSELFSELGTSRVRPFFSRRIGGVGTEPVPVLGGMRLSGKVGGNWNVGAMTMQTGSVDSLALSNNWSIATVQRNLPNGSIAKAFITNRQAFEGVTAVGDYNRTGGLEYEFQNKQWSAKAFYHLSFTDQDLDQNQAYGGKIRYTGETFSIFAGLDHVERNYVSDMGFIKHQNIEDENGDIVRIDFRQWRFNAFKQFYSPSPSIAYWQVLAGYDIFTGTDGSYQEQDFHIDGGIRFENGQEINLIYRYRDPLLFYAFDLPGLNQPFPVGNYPEHIWSLSVNTGNANNWTLDAEAFAGDKLLGRMWGIEGEAEYRFQPNLWLSLNASYQRLYDFPEEYGSAHLQVYNSRISYAYNRRLFLTVLGQYNSKKDQFGTNIRFRYQFSPLSDFYIVYTDDYVTDNSLVLEGQAIVFKVNLWLSANTVRNIKAKMPW